MNSRKKFIESHGGSCNNWYWSWSFINKKEKFIIFGAWDTNLTRDGSTLIFSEEWEFRRERKQKGFEQSLEHIRLIEEEGYKLFTFPMIRANPDSPNEPAKILEFVPELTESWIFRKKESWYSIPRQSNKSTKKSRNPAWIRDELILALDLYFKEPAARGNSAHPDVIRLSRKLNSLQIHSGASNQTFRNPNGVAMKLSNFLQFDSTYRGKGLRRGNKLEREVWDQYSKKRGELSKIAGAILTNSEFLKDSAVWLSDIDEDAEASEGKVLSKIHKYRERDRKITKKKKESVLRRTGRLKCEACGFDFSEVYGDRGIGFAECHHRVPVSEISPDQKTKLQDLAIICANCHRMIHRSKPWLTIEELTELM